MPEKTGELYESILIWLARSRENRPGRVGADECIDLLQHLAGAMQNHPAGRQLSVSRDWASGVLKSHFRNDVSRAQAFLVEEEKDSGIIVNRGTEVKFWHPIFQEHLAARLLSTLRLEQLHSALFDGNRAWLPEWREMLVLLGGLLHLKGEKEIDRLISRVLDDLYGDLSRGRKLLLNQTRYFGLLGTILRDLQSLGFTPSDSRYGQLKNSVLAIFDPKLAGTIPLKTRLEAADALGQAGDPRLRLPHDPDYWVRAGDIEIGKFHVTVHEYRFFVDDGGSKPDDWDRQVLLRTNCPVANVSWFDAVNYCEWAKVRLPTGEEWERAARGAEGRLYPWGNAAPDLTRANYSATELNRVSPVGLFPRGSTPDGILDMAGNIWEWVDEWYDDSKKIRVVRGGWYYSGAKGLRPSRRYRNYPDYKLDDVGFRCARDIQL